jgi:hypothetical protein
VARDFVEVVLAALGQVDVGVLLTAVRDGLVTGPRRRLLLGGRLLLESGRRSGFAEVELVLVVALPDLLVERLGPLLVVVYFVGDAGDVAVEVQVAVGLDVLLVAADDGVVEVVLRARLLLQQVLLLISDELVVVLLDLVLVIGVQILNWHHLLNAIDLPELIHKLKTTLVTHNLNITISQTLLLHSKWNIKS